MPGKVNNLFYGQNCNSMEIIKVSNIPKRAKIPVV